MARKLKETRHHLEVYAKDKMATLDRNCSNSSSIEATFAKVIEELNSATAATALMDKRLKDISKYVAQVDIDTKNDLQGLDSKG